MNTPLRSSSCTLGHVVGLCVLGLGQAWAQQSAQVEASPGIEEEARGDDSDAEFLRGQKLRVVLSSGVDQVSWYARLTDSDIDAREIAYEELVARARWDAELGLAIEAWSLDPEMPELAWTSRMALRELNQSARRLRREWIDSEGGDQASTDSRSEAAMLRAIDIGDLLPPSERLQPLSPRKSLSMYQPRAFQTPRRVARHVFKLDVQPEGVVLTEFIHDGTRIRQQRYAAESSAALLEAYPGLRSRVPGLVGILAKPFGPGSQFQWDRGRQQLSFGSSDPGYGRDVASPDLLAVTPVVTFLGVKVTRITEEASSATLLGPGVGLVIERREPGSMAENLGLQRGDILFELAGEPLCSPAEISRVLQQSRGQREIILRFIDRFGLERTVTWSPKAPR